MMAGGEERTRVAHTCRRFLSACVRVPDNGRIHRDKRRRDVCATHAPHSSCADVLLSELNHTYRHRPTNSRAEALCDTGSCA